jgi:hypothetical protein
MDNRSQAITKDELRQLLTDWGCRRLSSQELRSWMESNYYPLHLEIGPSEPKHVQKAMHTIMNEFELVGSDHFVPEHYRIALEFLDTIEQDYEQAQQKFLEQCFQ